MTMREPKRPRQRITGWVNLYKPLNIGSTQAVSTLKWALRPEKIGHAGTLDPLATGVLPIALGEATKCVNLLMDAKKTYHFTVQFGQRRSTDDAARAPVMRRRCTIRDRRIRRLRRRHQRCGVDHFCGGL